MNPSLRNMTSLFFVEEEGLWCLFRQGSRVANNKYVGACGGHFEESELSSPEACVLREMKEELGLDPDEIEGLALRYVTLRGMDREIRQNYYFFARLKGERQLASSEGEIRFFTWKELEIIDMPVSARHMMDHYLKVGRFDEYRYAGITEPGGSRFVRLQYFE
jgi:8-oxo-dGTP diphosphatase